MLTDPCIVGVFIVGSADVANTASVDYLVGLRFGPTRPGVRVVNSAVPVGLAQSG